MDEIQIRGSDKAQFKIYLFEGATFMMTLHLLKIDSPDYYDLYHEEGRNEIVLSQ